jgi:pimeloyl-ACP methyl ester carboxylesterase
MPAVIANDGTLLYAETHGDGIPVIFSCAYCTTHENWRSQVEDLVDAGFQIILWDYRGHGKSATPEDIAAYSMEKILDDLMCILDWAANGQSAVLTGHSFGGFASLHFAVKHPDRVRALILVGSGPGFRNPKAAKGWMAQMERTAAFL